MHPHTPVLPSRGATRTGTHEGLPQDRGRALRAHEKHYFTPFTSWERARHGTQSFAGGFLAPALAPRGGVVLIITQQSRRLGAAGFLLQASQEAPERHPETSVLPPLCDQ